MGNELYIALDASRAGDEVLVKKVNDEYLSKTFGEAMDYLLNPEADSLNSEYNSGQREVASNVSGWFERKQANPNSLEIELGAYGTNEQRIPVRLDDVMGDYSGRVLKEEPGEPDEEPYRVIQMYARMHYGGG